MCYPNAAQCNELGRALLEKLHPYTNIPSELKHELTNYVVRGAAPGDYLRAILEMSLKDVAYYADPNDAKSIVDLTLFVLTYLPPQAKGNPDSVDGWAFHHGVRHYNLGDAILGTMVERLRA